ncbi:MAG: ASCH domain-containing protein [Planctomycetaceae bacterium]|nr:ASCH domain-containing protein [Planctomycetaceae bacterium]
MSAAPPDLDRLALGIQQPWAELILRGVKTLEVRSQPTRTAGTIYLYASRRPSTLPAAAEIVERLGLDLGALPKGLLVGTVELVGCRSATPADAAMACVPQELLAGQYVWELGNPQRLAEPLAPRFLPYGVWFYPFRRKGASPRRSRG